MCQFGKFFLLGSQNRFMVLFEGSRKRVKFRFY